MNKNFFLVLEGIDGCGKDTQLLKLMSAIRSTTNHLTFGNKYNNVWVTSEPTSITSAGREISQLIREPNADKQKITKLFIQDRIEHSPIIESFLTYSHVICSRYDLSTYAYQRSVDYTFEKIYESLQYDKIKVPDITLLFDLPANIALQRTSDRQEVKTIFDKQSVLEKTRQNYLEATKWLQGKGRQVTIINANQPVEGVTKDMFKAINKSVLVG